MRTRSSGKTLGATSEQGPHECGMRELKLACPLFYPNLGRKVWEYKFLSKEERRK